MTTIREPKDLHAQLNWVSMEFLHRVVNELKGRRFEYREEPINEGQRGDFVSANIKAQDFFKVLPDVSREFAAKIEPRFTRCHQLAPLPVHFDPYTSRDPIGGMSIRCVLQWDVIRSEMIYRFDAAFS